MKTYVNGFTLIGTIMREYPEAVDVLLDAGMHCLGCPASQAESLADACSVHMLDAAPVVAAVNARIAQVRE